MTTSSLIINKRPLNHRQKQVAINMASGMSGMDAYLNVYHCDPETAKRQSSVLNTSNCEFKAYLNDLLERKTQVSLAKQAETVLSKNEKRQILATIARAQLTDLLDDNGKIKLDKRSPAAKALKEWYSREGFDREGNPTLTSSMKLIDPIAAIVEDNKMSGDYAPTKHMVAQRVQFEISLVDKKRGSE